jgi:hypothetical protein
MNALVVGLARRAVFMALLAMAGSCGDAEGGASAGRDAGEAGRDGSASRGGSGGDRGDAGAAQVTRMQCLREAVQTASAQCLACVCEIDPREVVACADVCWALVTCVHAECRGDGSDGECIGRECADHLAGVSQANTFGPVFGECADVCATAQSDSDGGS